MKGKSKRKSRSEDERPPEPRWKQRKPARRRNARNFEAVASNVAAARPAPRAKGRERSGGDGGSRGGARKPRLHLPALHMTWRRWALLALLALLAAGSWELGYNDHFYVMQPEIVGNVRVPADEIAAASDIQGTHILWVRGTSVADRVKKLDGIVDATVHVRLPNQVIIEVNERTPLLVWKVGSQEVWVSTDGAAMAAVGAPPALTLTDVDAAAASPALPATAGKVAPVGAAQTPELRPQVLAEIKALEASRPEVKNLFYGRQQGLYFTAPEGWAVYLGVEGDVARKLATLQAVREKAANDGTPLKVVDLRLEGQAFYW